MSLAFRGEGGRVVVDSGSKDVVGEDESEGLELFALATELMLNWKKRQLAITKMGTRRILLICEEY